MTERQLWVDHIFNLDIHPGWAQNIMSRIEDCPLRLSNIIKGLSDYELSKNIDGAYSIKEHIGHLIDLESLWINRFDQFEKGLPELVHADMSNQKTKEANHNESNIDNLLEKFKHERDQLISTFKNLSEKALNHKSLHPRLKVIMQPVDLLFFVAEHDDHHITSMKLLANEKD
ncbi:MAG: DinB family protein [Saprospiraceae bacterium]|nr:DinB family protein [Bacteroidia bacterium]NNE15207.1 DinB family protein [Saprospiraceae bacterium]NNL93232.1 DinB family protein [Saprospiraceae bacterium]